MSNVVLILGPIVFQDFEVPPAVVFGGGQRLAVHKLPGGDRVIDALGRDDASIVWHGVFSGPDANIRAALLNELRAQGLVLTLTWDIFIYSVLISEFVAEYRQGWWIPYRIVCTVVQDAAQLVLDAVGSLLQQGQSDLGIAAGYATAGGVDLSGATTTFDATGATTLGTGAYNDATTALSGAQTAIQNGMNGAEATLAPIGSAAVPLGATTAAGGAVALASATTSAGQLAQLAGASAFVNRTAVNLGNASS